MGSMLSAFLRRSSDGVVGFWCPGCDEAHFVSVAPGGWTWDGNAEAPTFSPSVLVRSGHHADRKKPCWCDFNREHPGESRFKCGVCHSFVRGGRIEFLSDCTHPLADQTVPIPAWPETPADPEVKP